MAWHRRICRFMHTHWVFEQEGDESCGPSCGMMIAHRLRNVRLDAEDSYVGMEGYGMHQAVGTYNENTRPTDGGEMARYLKMMLGQSTQYQNPRLPSAVKTGVVANLKASKPVVMGVMWRGAHGPLGDEGGHWVCVDKISRLFGSTYVCVCDPGDGHVHPVKWNENQGLVYRPGYSAYGGELDDYIEFA